MACISDIQIVHYRGTDMNMVCLAWDRRIIAEESNAYERHGIIRSRLLVSPPNRVRSHRSAHKKVNALHKRPSDILNNYKYPSKTAVRLDIDCQLSIEIISSITWPYNAWYHKTLCGSENVTSWIFRIFVQSDCSREDKIEVGMLILLTIQSIK